MKTLRALQVLLILALVFGQTGCETLDPRDHALLEQHHVSGAVVDKMLHNERLELADITELSKRRVPDPFILNYLRSTYATYQLTSSDVSDLAKSGVSRPVIDYLMATPAMYGPPQYPYEYPGYPYGFYPYDYPPTVVVVNPHYYHHW